MSFDTSRVIACRPSDARLARVYASGYCGWEQTCGDPLMLIVPPAARDDQCASLADRFHVNAADLIQFRDGKADVMELRA